MTFWTQDDLSDTPPFDYNHLVKPGFLIVCPKRMEYLDSSVFGPHNVDNNNALRNDVFLALGILLSSSAAGCWRDLDYWAPARQDDETVREWRERAKFGLWCGSRITIIFEGEDDLTGAATSVMGGKMYQSHLYVRSEYKDISYEMLGLFSQGGAHARRVKPNNFRRIVGMLCHRPRNDYSYLMPCDIPKLKKLAKRCRIGFWEGLKAWLRRRKLSDDTRRKLGGRPGGTVAGAAKKRQDEHKRQQRRVVVRD